MTSPEARALHQRSTVIDGLVFQSDGTDTALRAGNVAAVNVTVCGLNAEFDEACDQLAAWLHRLAAPRSPWFLIRNTADTPFVGIGKPEPLKYRNGVWSRRINSEHRLIYQVTNDSIIVVHCRYHYDD